MRRSTTAIITATEITRTGYFYKYTCSHRSIDLCVLPGAYHELFCVFGGFYASGTQDAGRRGNKITLVSTSKIWLDIYYNNNVTAKVLTLISAYCIL